MVGIWVRFFVAPSHDSYLVTGVPRHTFQGFERVASSEVLSSTSTEAETVRSPEPANPPATGDDSPDSSQASQE